MPLPLEGCGWGGGCNKVQKVPDRHSAGDLMRSLPPRRGRCSQAHLASKGAPHDACRIKNAFRLHGRGADPGRAIGSLCTKLVMEGGLPGEDYKSGSCQGLRYCFEPASQHEGAESVPYVVSLSFRDERIMRIILLSLALLQGKTTGAAPAKYQCTVLQPASKCRVPRDPAVSLYALPNQTKMLGGIVS